MSHIIPFDAPSLPVRRQTIDVTADLKLGADYPTLSIKGKHFAVVTDGTPQILMMEDGETPRLALALVALRANDKARVYYVGDYDPGSASAPPDCFTNDGVAPDSSVQEPQSRTCALCPHAVFGTGREGRGTACRSVTRLAVATPNDLSRAHLLRLPITSVKDRQKKAGFKDAVSIARERGYQYNEVVFRVSFDHDAESPKLLWKPQGILDDAAYQQAVQMYNDPLVLEITGLTPAAAAPAAPVPAAPVPAAPVPAAPVPAAPAPAAPVPAAPAPAAPAPAAPAPAAPAPAADPLEAELAAGIPVTAPPAPRRARSKTPATPAPAAPAAPAADPLEAELAAGVVTPPAEDPLLENLDALLGGYDD
jgi:hypothetical protein